MQQKRFGAWSSSTDPAEISSTVESVIKVLAMLLSALGAMKGLDWAISASEIQNYASLITAGIVGALVVWQSSQALWFAARKIFYRVYPPVA